MTKFLTSPRTSQDFHLHITSSQSALSAPTLAEPIAASLLQGLTQARGSDVSMLQGSSQAKRSVQLRSARKDDSGKMAGRCVCVASFPGKSWRQKRPGNVASVSGEIVVHTEMMLIMKRG